MTILASPIFGSPPATGGLVRTVTVAEINAGQGMYGFYDAIGAIDDKFLPVSNGITVIERIYTRTSTVDEFVVRHNGFDPEATPGVPPWCQFLESDYTFIDVETASGIHRIDFRLTSNGGDVFSAGFTTNGIIRMNASPPLWTASDVGNSYTVTFIP